MVHLTQRSSCIIQSSLFDHDQDKGQKYREKKEKKHPKEKIMGSCKVFKLACHVFTFLTTYHLIPVPHSSVGQPTLQEPGCPGCYLDLVAGGKMKPLSDLFFSPNLFFRQLTGFLFTSSQVPLELLKDSREGVQSFNYRVYIRAAFQQDYYLYIAMLRCFFYT